MAAGAIDDIPTRDAITFGGNVAEVRRGTSPRSFDAADRGHQNPQFPSMGRFGVGLGTISYVAPDELGQDKDEEISGSGKPSQTSRAKAVLSILQSAKGSRERSELARELVKRTESVVPAIGSVSMATQLRLLTRDLARCHDALQEYPSESSFLSIVTLVESALSQTKWNKCDAALLDSVKAAVDIGYRKATVNYDDYESIRSRFEDRGIVTGVRIDLDHFSLDELEDGEEAEEDANLFGD